MSASTASRLKLLAELAALLPGPSTAVELLDRVEASGLLGTLRLVLVRSDEPRESSPGPDGLHRLQAALLPDETSGRQLELWGPSGPPPDGELGIVLHVGLAYG